MNMLPRRRWFQWAATIAVVAAALVAAEARFFFGDGYHFGGQFADSYALHRLASESLREGWLPLWSPNLLCGYPLHAALAVSPFYPPAALLLAADPSYRLFEFYAILHLLFAGASMALLLNGLGCSWRARTLGAVCFATCGFNLAQLGHTASFAVPAAWLPLVLLGWHRLAQHVTLRRAALVAVPSALVLLEGHLQIAAYALALGLAWFGWQQAGRSHRPTRSKIGRSLILCLVVLCLALAIAAPRLLPSAAFLRETALPEDQGSGMHAAVRAYEVLTIPWPGIAQAMQQVWGNRAAVETYAYVGMVPFLLAVLAVPTRRGRFFAISGLVAVAAAAGCVESLNGLLAHVGLPAMRSQARPLLVLDLSLAVLAALGLDQLRHIQGRRLGRSLAACAAVLLLAGALAPVLGALPKNVLHNYGLAAAPGCVFLLLAVSALVLVRRIGTPVLFLLLVADVSYFSNRLPQPFQWSPEETLVQYTRRPLRDIGGTIPVPRIHTANLHGLSNAPLTAGLHVTAAWVGWRRVPWRYKTLLDELRPSATTSGGQLLPLLSAPYVLVDRSRPAPPTVAALPVEGFTGAFNLLRYDAALPRAYVVHSVQVVPSWHQALHMLHSGQVDPRFEAVLEIAGAHPDSLLWTSDSDASVTFREYRDNRMTLEVALGAPGALVLLETYYPGWQATINGKATPLYPAQLAFRGILLEAGTHLVEMRFRDVNLTVGLALSGIAAAIVVVSLAVRPRDLS